MTAYRRRLKYKPVTTLPFRAHTDIARALFTSVVARGAELLPILTFEQGGKVNSYHTVELSYGLLCRALNDIVASGPIGWIVFTHDGYHYDCSPETAPDDLILAEYLEGRVTLGELFAQGHPNVHEALSVVAVDIAGSVVAWLPYVRDRVNATVAWREEPLPYDPSESKGPFIDILNAAFTVSHLSPHMKGSRQ